MFDGLAPSGYRTIVVDPPWRYNATAGLPTNGYKPSTAEAHYTTMANDEIAALPVGGLASPEGAHCYLWVTVPRLFGERGGRGPAPVEILEGWGFEFKTMLTWVKTGRVGMGWWFRGHAEHVLFGVRGGAPIPEDRRESNVVVAKRGRHSEKPGAFFDLVERVSPPARVELFARAPRLGWDHWGLGYES